MSRRELAVYPYDTKHDLYREAKHGFIVKQNDGAIIALGLLDPHTQQIRKLTDEERDLAQTIGMAVQDGRLDSTRKKELQAAKSLTAPVAELQKSLNLSMQEKVIVDRISSSIAELLVSLDISAKEQALIEKIEAAIADCEKNNIPDDKTIGVLVQEANTYNNQHIRQLVESLHTTVAEKRTDALIHRIEQAIAACESDEPPNENDYAALLRESERYRSVRIAELLDSLQAAIVETMDLLEEKECCVCRMWEKTMIFIPCGHVAVCRFCAQKQKWKACPICKAQVQGVYRMYY